jgi:hypothetical protein
VKKKAKALAHKLKECDTMHEELERLRNIERLVINMRMDQQAGIIPNDALLPDTITSLLPHIDTSRPKRSSTPKRNSTPTRSSTPRRSSTIDHKGGQRRKTTRRRKIRRRKTK